MKSPAGSSLAERLEYYSMPEPNGGCQLWLGNADRDGYGMMNVNGRTRMAHRLAWELANSAIPPGLKVCHKCDVPSCINPDHLFLGTQADNVSDMITKGRRAPDLRGEQKSLSVLTEDDVRSIRTDPRTLTAIAADYGVTHSLISKVKLRQSWRHVA